MGILGGVVAVFEEVLPEGDVRSDCMAWHQGDDVERGDEDSQWILLERSSMLKGAQEGGIADEAGIASNRQGDQ